MRNTPNPSKQGVSMIQQFAAIRNVGTFSDYRASGNIDFQKLTLIYGANGCGKTTLAAILRSLKSGIPVPISERQTLSSTASAEVDIRGSSRSTTFRNGEWSTTVPN